MANFTGANVCDVVEIETYQPDIFGFGIASGDSKVSHYISQTTNDIFRELRIMTFRKNIGSFFVSEEKFENDIMNIVDSENKKKKINLIVIESSPSPDLIPRLHPALPIKPVAVIRSSPAPVMT